MVHICAIINYPNSSWKNSALIEQVYLVLISVLEKDDITRRYEKRARWLIRRFNVWDPPPEFIIYQKDFPSYIYQQLVLLRTQSPKTLNYVMTRALEMIFDGIEEVEERTFNKEYYLLSVRRNKTLTWRFDKPEDQKTDQDSKYDINFPVYASNGIEIKKER